LTRTRLGVQRRQMPRRPITGKAMANLQVLACTRCGQPLPAEMPQHCNQCGADYELVDGDILSFLPAGAGSALDEIDYDAVYKIDDKASDTLYRQCKSYLGPLLSEGARSYLEIGAGTGLFTLAFLSDARPRQALITDVSAKMLAICRARLESRDVATHTDVGYALWDGTTPCFIDRSFDFVAGFSVLHHVLDYQQALGYVRDALTEDGRAIFLEPSLAFHRAIIGFMSDVIQTMPTDDPVWTSADRGEVAVWIGENYINTKFHGDWLALELREDKHMFDGNGVRRAAAEARFGRCHVIPFGDENEVWRTITVYMGQLPISPESRNFLLHHCARKLPGPFVHLAPEDRAPSFLIVLERGGAAGASLADPAKAAVPVHGPVGVFFRHPEPNFRYALEFSMQTDPESGLVELTAKGWIFGDVDIRQLEVGADVRFPVGAMRMDVERLLNADFSYPLLRALCCGLLEVRPQFLDPSAHEEHVIIVVTMAGDRYVLGRLVVGTPTLNLEHIAGGTLEAIPAPA
jgi:SAM-dependent methyltransferase